MINPETVATNHRAPRRPLAHLWDVPKNQQRADLTARVMALRAGPAAKIRAAIAARSANNVTCLGLNVTRFQSTFRSHKKLRAIVVRAVSARVMGVCEDDLTVRSRRASVIKVQHMAIFAMYMLTETSACEIGRLFGGRDHSTVLYATQKVREWYCSGDPYVWQTFWKIRQAALSVEGQDPFFWGS